MGNQDMTGHMRKRVWSEGLMRKRSCVLAVVAVLVLISATAAQGAFFDTSGKSARSMGMGEVFLATAGDASSYWYNPAGLAKYGKRQIGLSYGIPVSTVSDLNISQINFVTPIGGNMGLGLGVSYGGVDVANDMVISGGYGIALSDRFAVGGNVKIMRWAVDGQPLRGGSGKDDNLSKTSFSLDLSATMGLGNWFGAGDFSGGVYVKDAIMPNISESGADGGKLPVEAGIGLMMQREEFTVEGNAATKDGNTFFRLGGETNVPGSKLKARAGVIYGSNFESDLERFDANVGLGYAFSSVVFNYAYNVPVEIKNSGGKHYFSFGVSF
jgi:hypothetical protein